MNIAIVTLGCKTNQAESMEIQHGLIRSGHNIVQLEDNPDICIINTCSVTAKADYQSRQLINKTNRMCQRVIVTGCYSELNSSYISKNYNVEIVPNKEKSNIINIIPSLNLTTNLNKRDSFRHRPMVKVQDGCNYSCSYCTIPFARGKSKSVEPAKIVEKVNKLVSEGYHEIVLTGIHLGLYGLDLNPRIKITKLLEELLLKTKISRIRLSSLETTEIYEPLLEIMTDKRICNHLHIPLQSGNDNILNFMNRTYTSRDYIKTIELILKKFQNISIGTDIIVGFPGETEDRFYDTKSLVELIPFSYLHVFPYSERPNTRALSLKGKIRDEIKKRRVAKLKQLDKLKREEFIKRNIGIHHSAVLETIHKNGILGTTSNYIKVFIESSDITHKGILADIMITGYNEQFATAKLIKKFVTP